ncbi:unnamed protein product, partial [Staurois parvus]
SVRTGRGGKRPDWKGGKASGLEGGESVRTGRGGKRPDWKGGGESVRTGRGGKCPDWKWLNCVRVGRVDKFKKSGQTFQQKQRKLGHQRMK